MKGFLHSLSGETALLSSLDQLKGSLNSRCYAGFLFGARNLNLDLVAFRGVPGISFGDGGGELRGH